MMWMNIFYYIFFFVQKKIKKNGAERRGLDYDRLYRSSINLLYIYIIYINTRSALLLGKI